MEGGEPVHARHHDVEDDDMGRVGGCLLQRVFTVDRGLDFEPFQFEVDLDHGEDVRIVVRYEDSFTHRPSIVLLSSAAAADGSSAPKIAVPATKTFAPASWAMRAFRVVIPPSI